MVNSLGRHFGAIVSFCALLLPGCALGVPEATEDDIAEGDVHINYADGTECNGSAATCATEGVSKATADTSWWTNEDEQPSLHTLGNVLVTCCGASCFGEPIDCSNFCTSFCAPPPAPAPTPPRYCITPFQCEPL